MRSAAGLLEVLEREHQAHGLSLRQQARRLGISHSTLVLLRQGKIRPGLHVVDQVSARLPQYARDYLFPPEGQSARRAADRAAVGAQ